jgi:hypothetical protein
MKECGVITLTLRTKRVFRTVVRSGLPEGKALRLVLRRRTKDGGLRVGIKVDEPEYTDLPVFHEGETIAWVSVGVMEACDGHVLDLEEEWPKGADVAVGTSKARRATRSYRHSPWGSS